MGCDFFYSGALEDEELQKKVVLFAQSYYQGPSNREPLILDLNLKIKFHKINNGVFNTQSEFFNLDVFGIIPDYWDDTINERQQFVFDRSSGGQLVKMLGLPHQITGSLVSRENIVEPGGYFRGINDSMEFALFLYITKLRYFSTLEVVDDYQTFKLVTKHVSEFGFNAMFKNENFEFAKCKDMFFKVYERHIDRPQGKEAKTKKQIKDYFSKLITLPINPAKINLSDIDFSVRTKNCLKRFAKIETLEELMAMSEPDLWKVKNLGGKSIREIIEFFEFIKFELP